MVSCKPRCSAGHFISLCRLTQPQRCIVIPEWQHTRCGVEYFHDHARIERMLFDGAAVARNGAVAPDLDRPGLGIEFKEGDAHAYEVD